jgi:hypothetical protein
MKSLIVNKNKDLKIEEFAKPSNIIDINLNKYIFDPIKKLHNYERIIVVINNYNTTSSLRISGHSSYNNNFKVRKIDPLCKDPTTYNPSEFCDILNTEIHSYLCPVNDKYSLKNKSVNDDFLNSSCYVTSIFDAPYESDTVNCNDNLECNYINNWKVNNYTDSVDKNDQKSKILFFKDEDLVLYVDTSSKDNKYTHDNYVFLVQNIKEYMIDNNIKEDKIRRLVLIIDNKKSTFPKNYFINIYRSELIKFDFKFKNELIQCSSSDCEGKLFMGDKINNKKISPLIKIDNKLDNNQCTNNTCYKTTNTEDQLLFCYLNKNNKQICDKLIS